MSELPSTLSRSQAQRRIAQLFGEAGLDNAALDARLLLCHALGIDHAALIRDPDLPLGASAKVLEAAVMRRLAREPVARIVGQREFWGLPFTISPDVLDPRPETELIVETALGRLGARRQAPLRILDLGTGSGAILAALLHECPQAFGLGLDRSFAACRIARDNLMQVGFAPRSAVVCGSWNEALGAPFDLVVSNPPYITSADCETLAPEVRDHDPRAALDGGPDGLAPYRIICASLGNLLRPGGFIVFEIGTGQSPDVMALLRAAGARNIGVRHDLAGHDRVVFGSLPDEVVP